MKSWTKYANQVAVLPAGQKPADGDFFDCCPKDHNDIYGAIICRDSRIDWETIPPAPDCKNLAQILVYGAARGMDGKAWSGITGSSSASSRSPRQRWKTPKP